MTTKQRTATRHTGSELPYTVRPLARVRVDEAISDYESLVNHLHQAAQVEMSTIPMYLYAAYSIETKGHSQWDPGISAFRTIVAVAIEEMLHLCMVRNIMVAIGAGDRIAFYDKNFMPPYPSKMLHRTPDLTLHLSPCTTQLMEDVFLPLELPAKHHAKPQADQYETLGQFYRAIEIGLKHVDRAEGHKLWKHAKHNAAWQYENAYWNRDGGGEPVVVTDLATALMALEIVVEQGEGVDPEKAVVPIDPVQPRAGLEELSHYARFLRIKQEIEVIGQVRSVPRDPKVSDFDEPAATLAHLFNAVYCYTLAMLDKLYDLPAHFSPETPNTRYHLERTFVSAMGGLLYPLADLLMQTAAKNGKEYSGAANEAFFAGPTFEYYDFLTEMETSSADTMKQHLIWLCDQAIAEFPKLGGDNSVRWLLDKLPDIDSISSEPPISRPHPR